MTKGQNKNERLFIYKLKVLTKIKEIVVVVYNVYVMCMCMCACNGVYRYKNQVIQGFKGER